MMVICTACEHIHTCNRAGNFYLVVYIIFVRICIWVHVGYIIYTLYEYHEYNIFFIREDNAT